MRQNTLRGRSRDMMSGEALELVNEFRTSMAAFKGAETILKPKSLRLPIALDSERWKIEKRGWIPKSPPYDALVGNMYQENQTEVLWWGIKPLSTKLLYVHVVVVSNDLGKEKQRWDAWDQCICVVEWKQSDETYVICMYQRNGNKGMKHMWYACIRGMETKEWNICDMHVSEEWKRSMQHFCVMVKHESEIYKWDVYHMWSKKQVNESEMCNWEDEVLMMHIKGWDKIRY